MPFAVLGLGLGLDLGLGLKGKGEKGGFIYVCGEGLFMDEGGERREEGGEGGGGDDMLLNWDELVAQWCGMVWYVIIRGGVMWRGWLVGWFIGWFFPLRPWCVGLGCMHRKSILCDYFFFGVEERYLALKPKKKERMALSNMHLSLINSGLSIAKYFHNFEQYPSTSNPINPYQS